MGLGVRRQAGWRGFVLCTCHPNSNAPRQVPTQAHHGVPVLVATLVICPRQARGEVAVPSFIEALLREEVRVGLKKLHTGQLWSGCKGTKIPASPGTTLQYEVFGPVSGVCVGVYVCAPIFFLA